MKIGIAGTGRMGAAIGLRLMEVGHELTVWNRTPGKAQPLAAAGAKVAATPAALVDASEIVITMLTDDKSIEDLYHRPGGLLSGDAKGRLFIEMSTVRPEVERAVTIRPEPGQSPCRDDSANERGQRRVLLSELELLFYRDAEQRRHPGKNHHEEHTGEDRPPPGASPRATDLRREASDDRRRKGRFEEGLLCAPSGAK